MISFNVWLSEQRDRKDEIGAFARAARRWQNKPKTVDSASVPLNVRWIDFLHGARLWTVYGETLTKGLDEYSQYCRRKSC